MEGDALLPRATQASSSPSPPSTSPSRVVGRMPHSDHSGADRAAAPPAAAPGDGGGGPPALVPDDDDEDEDPHRALGGDAGGGEGGEGGEGGYEPERYKYQNRAGPRARNSFDSLLAPEMATISFNITTEDFAQEWYHKRATRSTATTMLSGKPTGTFLIRPSSQRGCYAMTWVGDRGEVNHNLIYGLFPGYSLQEKPTNEKDRYWNLTALVRGCDFLVAGHPKSKPRPEHGEQKASKNTAKSSAEVVGRVAELLAQNVSSLSTLAWTLSMTECMPTSWEDAALGISTTNLRDDKEQGNVGVNFMSGAGTEKRTFVRYCGKEYVAPELLPLNGNAAKAVLDAIAHNTTLVSLSVLGDEGMMHTNFAPNFTDREAIWLAQALRYGVGFSDCKAHTMPSGNTTLTHLELSVNSIGDAGATALARALRKKTNVKLLDLSRNFIGRSGLTALAELLRENRHIRSLKVSNQLRWDGTLHTVVLQSGASERAIAGMIDSSLQRRAEIQMGIGDHFHGFLSRAKVYKLLDKQPQGSYLFHLNENLPNVLVVSFVVVGSSGGTQRDGVVFRQRTLYRAEQGYSFNRRHQKEVFSLVDYAAWRVCSDSVLYKQFEVMATHQLHEVKERMAVLKDLFYLWRIGSYSLPLLLGNHEDAAMGDVFPTLPYLVRKNKDWLVRPIRPVAE